VHPPAASSPGIAQRVLGPSLPGPRAPWASNGRRALSACCVALPLAVGLVAAGALGTPAGPRDPQLAEQVAGSIRADSGSSRRPAGSATPPLRSAP
jgi:hypothetical protein